MTKGQRRQCVNCGGPVGAVLRGAPRRYCFDCVEARNREKAAASRAAYRARNREKVAAYQAVYRARKRSHGPTQ